MNPYSADLCKKIVAQLERGIGPSEVARKLEVHRSTVYRAWWRYKKSGRAEGRMPGGHRRSKLLKHQKEIEQWIGAKPDMTLEEVRERCRKDLGVDLHLSSVGRFLEQIGFSYKKNSAGQRTRSK